MVGVGWVSASPPSDVTKLVTDGRRQQETAGAPLAWQALNIMLAVGTWGSPSSCGAVGAGLGIQRPCACPRPLAEPHGTQRGVHGLSLDCNVQWTDGLPTLAPALLRSEVHRLHVAPREETNVPAEPASPPVGVQALEDFDDVTAAEAEL